jgi:hypothetical protein
MNNPIQRHPFVQKRSTPIGKAPRLLKETCGSWRNTYRAYPLYMARIQPLPDVDRDNFAVWNIQVPNKRMITREEWEVIADTIANRHVFTRKSYPRLMSACEYVFGNDMITPKVCQLVEKQNGIR